MTIYFIKGELGCYPVSEVIETEDYFLVPVPNTYEYTYYSKKLYRVERQTGYTLKELPDTKFTDKREGKP